MKDKPEVSAKKSTTTAKWGSMPKDKGAASIKKIEKKPGQSMVSVKKRPKKSSDSAGTAPGPRDDHYLKLGDVKQGEGEEFYDLVGKSISQQEWYHGFMPREDCEEVMKENGDFILRRTTVDSKPYFILSVMVADESKKVKCTHIRIDYKDSLWSINDGIKKASLVPMVKHYMAKGSSKYSKLPGPLLRTPIRRPDYYLVHENIYVGQQVGHGAFGTVHKGTLKEHGKTEPIEVAIKKMKSGDGAAKKHLLEFFKECRLMLRFNHPNVIRVYGVAPGNHPVLIVLELAAGGSLKSYCKKTEVEVSTLVGFAKDALKGMNYLQSEKVIHRDLAARNCLLGSPVGPNKVPELKISDFGLSHHGDSFSVDMLKSMPVKWLAPETLTKGRFSHKTDTWSFGIMLWELFIRCKTDPFPGMNNTEARGLIVDKNKIPMDPPPLMPPVIREVYVACLTFEEESRPDFTGLMRMLMPDEMRNFKQSQYLIAPKSYLQ